MQIRMAILLKDKAQVELDLACGLYRRKYSPYIASKVPSAILKHSVPVSPYHVDIWTDTSGALAKEFLSLRL